MLHKRTFLVWIALLAICGSAEAKRQKKPRVLHMLATANSVEGTTASGVQNKPGTAAADPGVLPLGTRIRVYWPSGYQHDFTITDTGPSVKGQHIDIFLPSATEAKKFGKQEVKVKVLKWGTGPESARERASRE